MVICFSVNNVCIEETCPNFNNKIGPCFPPTWGCKNPIILERIAKKENEKKLKKK